MNGRDRFDPGELRGADGPAATDAELAEAFAAARALEALTVQAPVTPTEGFEDRVMAAIATEPVPKVVVRPAGTVRGGRPAIFLAAVRDSWGVAWSGGRPLVVRAQAMGFVLLVLIATLAVSAVAVVGAATLLNGPSPAPIVSPSPAPTLGPSPSPSPSVEPTPTPSASSEPSASATNEPEPSDSAGPSSSAGSGSTARPTGTPDETDEPEGSDDHGGGSGSGGGGSGSGGDDDGGGDDGGDDDNSGPG